ncbi:uncharacterized protein LOC115886295 [Sitophilus oryzae]|uniref:Uncharacterized protein LOC115886295 n=1 Tax=Sitophilus oryzae TaxID=7048 RepID=A0A6J2YCV9_SITOR|nr:uncharacterized protein LOC115886295 [Sitophilus oryzae]
MAQFNIIAAGFNQHDETINFGGRLTAGDQSLYEIRTLATIKSENISDSSGTEALDILSYVYEGRIFFSINNVLRIMKGKEMLKELAFWEFSHRIDGFCVSGNHIMVCTRDGKITIINISSLYLSDTENSTMEFDFSPIFSEKIDHEYTEIFFIHCFADKTGNFCVVTSFGLIKRIRLIDGTKFEAEIIQDLERKMNISCYGHSSILLEGSELILLDIDNGKYSTTERIGLKLIKHLGMNYLAYSQNGDIYMINPFLFVFCINKTYPAIQNSFEDLIFVTDSEREGKYLMTGVTHKKSDGKSYIELCQFPDLNTIYSIPVMNPICLTQMDSSKEEALFFSKIFKNNCLEEIRLQCIYEADPELKLKRLLQKAKFEEAELFAEKYNISMEIVAQARAQHIVNKLSCKTSDIDQLFDIFTNISDQQFIMNCCDIVECEAGDDARRVIYYAAFMEIDVRDSNQNKDNPLLHNKILFNRRLHLFDTYMLIYHSYNHQKWNHFMQCDLLDELVRFLKNDDIEEAIIIFNRLDLDSINLLTDEKIQEILLVVDRCRGDINAFLTAFIPISLKYLPGTLTIFITWLHGRVYFLESQHSATFPECAIKFIEDVTKLMNINVPLRKHFSNEESPDKLGNLVNALKDIQLLQNNFGVKLHVSDYLADPTDTVRVLFTTNMDSKTFEMFTKQFLCSFIQRNNIDKDALFLEEIKNLLNYNEEYCIELVAILLSLMTGVDKKVEAIKLILETASTPWSDQVREISKIIFNFEAKNPLVQEMVEFLKEEPKLNILRKYDITWAQFASSKDKCFYYNRIFYLKGVDSVDDIRQLYTNKIERQQNEYAIALKLIRKEAYTRAMEILDDNPPEIIIGVCKDIISYTLNVNTQVSAKEDALFQDALNMVCSRIVDNTTHKGEIDTAKCDCHVAKAIYDIEKTFKIKSKCRDFFSWSERQILMDRLVQEIVESTNDNETVFEHIILLAKKVSWYMEEPIDAILVKLLEKIDFENILKLARFVLDSSSNSANLAFCAVYLFRFLKNDMIEDGNETFLDVLVNVPNKDEYYLNGVCLARDLIIKAINHATPDDHLAIMEVFRWINSCYLITNLKKNYTNEDVHQIYLPRTGAYPFVSSLESIKKVFNVYCSYIDCCKIPIMKYLTQFSSKMEIDQEQLLNELKQFTWNLNMFLKEDQHLTAYNMIKTLQYGLMLDPTIKTDTLNCLKTYLYGTWLPQMIDVVLSHQHIDKSLFYNLMMMIGSNFGPTLQKYLKLYKKRPTKLIVIAQVGLELLKYYGELEGMAHLNNISNMCKWWLKLKGTKMHYATFFTQQSDERLRDLVITNYVNLDNIQEYCTDFNLDLQESYKSYLETIILSWKPEIEYLQDVRGKKTIAIKNDEDALEKLCILVIQLINDKEGLSELTKNLWSKISFYYYEVYIILLMIDTAIGKVRKNFELYRPLLSFLKTYTRVGPPSRSEREQWYGAFPERVNIDELSAYRLPLTHIFFSNDIWNIIKPEVNLQTYKEWFQLTSILGQYLNKQDICTYAIKCALPAQVSENPKEWQLYSKYEHLVAQIDECASNITDLERATAAVYSLVGNMPPGADQVNIAQLSYKYAKAYKESMSSEYVDKIYNKVKQRYYNYLAMHILHKHQLADANYLDLVNQPKTLIAELYNDHRIVREMESVDFYCPDINTAVDELCNIFNLVAKKIRFELLSELLKSNTLFDLESTVVQVAHTHSFDQSNSIKRACYMCLGSDADIWRKLLLKAGTNKDGSESNMSYRANALRCFYYITDMETIEAMTEISHEEFRVYMDKTSVIAQMNDLGVCLESIEQLDEMNKKKLLKKLTQIHGRIAIKCIASLCKIYALDDLKYWQFIVETAIQLNMIQELMEYVEYLKYRCVTPFIIKAWHVILSDAFSLGANSSKSKTSESDVKDLYIKAIRLLQTCPVIYALDFSVYIEMCLINNQQVVAAVLLQYLPKNKLEKFIEIISTTQATFEELKLLKNNGIVGIDLVIDILKK